ncbi:hypothetical protein JCM11641_006043 [Rhodosporidiobolus odoratus]
MSPSYADATAAWQPQAASDQPKPDPSLLQLDESADEQHDAVVGLKATGKTTLEYTPPLTPPSEKEEPQTEEKKAAGTEEESKGEAAQQRKKVPGEGFAQSLKGDVTEQRVVPEDLAEKIALPWVARANIAPSIEKPDGTTEGGYAEKHKDEPVLKQHVAFFDKDGDNVIWPLDTWRGFRELGYSFFWCCFAMSVIHFFFSWFTAPGFLPDPFFRVFLKNGHRSKHGSDTGVYDSEGRFIPAKFEEIFTKFDKNGKGGLTFKEGLHMIHANRQACDPIGWAAEGFEWASTYLLIWPADGICDKESIRTVYDGSLFYVVADREREIKQQRRLARQRMTIPQLLWDSVPGVWKGWKKENKAAGFEFTSDKFEVPRTDKKKQA